MKNITKYVSAIALVCFGQQLVHSQSANQVRNRIEGTDRPIVPAQATGESPASSDGSSVSDASVSDTGAQRPVQLKDKGISSFVGYNSKYFYRDNPLSQPDNAIKQATGMWTNTFFGGAGLGVFDANDAIIAHMLG